MFCIFGVMAILFSSELVCRPLIQPTLGDRKICIRK
jgi:hypothetical protein